MTTVPVHSIQFQNEVYNSNTEHTIPVRSKQFQHEVHIPVWSKQSQYEANNPNMKHTIPVWSKQFQHKVHNYTGEYTIPVQLHYPYSNQCLKSLSNFSPEVFSSQWYFVCKQFKLHCPYILKRKQILSIHNFISRV